MISVIFVCLGNICRSPMAEAIFKRLAEGRGVAPSLEISSFATSDCEEGNPIYPPAKLKLISEGYAFNHRAKKLGFADIKNADYILVMDSANYLDVCEMAGEGYREKVLKLGGFLNPPKDIADPWYTGDFDRAYEEIFAACTAFLQYLLDKHAKVFAYDGGKR